MLILNSIVGPCFLTTPLLQQQFFGPNLKTFSHFPFFKTRFPWPIGVPLNVVVLKYSCHVPINSFNCPLLQQNPIAIIWTLHQDCDHHRRTVLPQHCHLFFSFTYFLTLKNGFILQVLGIYARNSLCCTFIENVFV